MVAWSSASGSIRDVFPVVGIGWRVCWRGVDITDCRKDSFGGMRSGRELADGSVGVLQGSTLHCLVGGFWRRCIPVRERASLWFGFLRVTRVPQVFCLGGESSALAILSVCRGRRHSVIWSDFRTSTVLQSW